MKISKRLTTIASYVDNYSYIIDVGCDHALLDIYIATINKNVSIIASDAKESPLFGAVENIRKYQMENKIQISLANGLEKLNDKVDTIIISGLGGNTIVDIFSKEICLDNIKKIILSPQGVDSFYEIRKKIVSLGFYIKDEQIIFDHKYYLIICFQKGKKEYSDIELKYGPVLLKSRTEEFINYYDSLCGKKEKIVKSKSLDVITRNNLIKEIEELRNILK